MANISYHDSNQSSQPIETKNTIIRSHVNAMCEIW